VVPNIEVTPAVQEMLKRRTLPLQLDMSEVEADPNLELVGVTEEETRVQPLGAEQEPPPVQLQAAEHELFLEPLPPTAKPRSKPGRKVTRPVVDDTIQLRAQDIKANLQDRGTSTLRCEYVEQDQVTLQNLQAVSLETAGRHLGEELGVQFQEMVREVAERRLGVWDWEDEEETQENMEEQEGVPGERLIASPAKSVADNPAGVTRESLGVEANTNQHEVSSAVSGVEIQEHRDTANLTVHDAANLTAQEMQAPNVDAQDLEVQAHYVQAPDVNAQDVQVQAQDVQAQDVEPQDMGHQDVEPQDIEFVQSEAAVGADILRPAVTSGSVWNLLVERSGERLLSVPGAVSGRQLGTQGGGRSLLQGPEAGEERQGGDHAGDQLWTHPSQEAGTVIHSYYVTRANLF
jgi:hypothetical protein